MTMRVSSFKPQCRQAPLHYPTPPRPVYEAFSPVLRPSDTPAEPPASGNDIESTNGVVSAIQHAGSTEKSGRAPSPLSLQPVAHELPPLKPHFSPALGSPIDALANVAASSLETSPVYPAPAGGPSRGLVSPTFAFARPHTREREPKHALPYPDSASTHDERPSKRARSEFFPSPFQSQQHSRPSTSHNPGWSYNVEQMADNGRRMYQESAAPAYYQQQQENQSKRLSDAQLLIDFAVRAETSVQPHVSNRHRWSSGHTTSSAENTLHTGKHSNSLHLAVPYHSVPPVNRAMPRDYEPHAHPNEAGPNGYLPNPIHLPSAQTHTPPEEHWNTGGLHTIDSEEKKPKKHQGWPKGKPRGPRNASATDRKKKTLPRPEDVPATVIMNQPTSEQLHSPQSPPKAPVAPLQNDLDLIAALQQTPSAPVLQSRRLSFSETSPPGEQSSHDISASARAQSVPVQTNTIASAATDEASSMGMGKKCDLPQVTICAGCHSTDSATSIGDGEQWISCDGCKEWFHYACAGFKSQREVRAIDKFYCEGCKPKFGNTTKLRKSNRTHTAVDYAGLNEGIMKTSDDNPEHHYIQAFKNGDIQFTPETFARLPPECVSADFIEKMNGFVEPVVMPGDLNPRPQYPSTDDSKSPAPDHMHPTDSTDDRYVYELVQDDGQDKLDMVIPDGLTVRRVAELYGPMETVPVIDVKAQEGEDKRWTMAKWADYYEQQGEKPVRNVISLEVSRSKLGRLIRRPKVVRDMDLQDSVWPEDDKIHAPPVQFYCLMSVADCYTDFHIDFGGSSVYYHIVKGRKTFFFIPPTKQNLKKYEDWCLSPGQSHEFLGLQVKECYRVDLYPGDTMLIPSGWIHAVWTPEDSLVIGGNYLTRIHYGMQIKVLEIEKNTKVAAKFRYPFFQKIMWLSVIRYLDEDPLPASVEELLSSGGQFERTVPIYCEPDKFGHNSDLGPENYNKRYYPKAELEGLTELQNYIWRTVLISQGRIDGITQQTRNAVTRSIPKGHGEPSVLARRFAMWIAWKKGNTTVPQWALSDAALPDTKPTPAQAKKLENETWSETLKLVRGGERHSSLRARVSESSQNGDSRTQAGAPVTGFLRPHREHVTTPKTSQLGPKRIACDACRRRRIRCKHKDELVESPNSSGSGGGSNGATHVPASSSPPATSSGDLTARRYSEADISSGPPPYPTLYDTQGSINGGPVSADMSADALANKSGRVKACADCRKSKRRCIHDEHGNVDPKKAAEAPVPRGSASKRRRVGDEEDGEALTKRIKMESFAGLVDGEVSLWNRYPLQKPRSYSASASREDTVVDSAFDFREQHVHRREMDIDPRLFEVGGNASGGAAPSNFMSRETVVSSIEDLPGDPMEGVIEAAPPQPRILNPEPRTPPPRAETPPGEANGVFISQIQPSPSPNDIQARPASMTPHWSRSSKGPRTGNAKSTTPKTTPNGKIKTEPKSDQRPRPVPPPPTTGKKNEDMASLALALKLQMEEHGLRRRSK